MDNYLIDGHKLYWHLDRLTAWQSGRMIVPIYIEVSPVSFCNHKCVFCAVDFAMEKPAKLKTEIFCKRIKEMAKLGVRSIMYAGEGEPLLHEDLPLFIKVAKTSGIDVSLTTNGSLGNYKLWKEILPHLSWLRFSFDAGSAGVYSLVHQVPEKVFQITIRSIKEALRVKNELKLPVAIGLQFLAIEENFKDLDKAISLAATLGVDYLSIKPFSLHPKMKKKKEAFYSLKTQEYIERTINKSGYPRNLNLIFRKDAFTRYMSKEKQYSRCRALPFWGYISSAGLFYTCSVQLGDKRFASGSIYKQDMRSIFFGKTRKQSIRFAQEELDVVKKCRLNCRMARINEFLEFLANKPEHLNFI
jgi:GTP 3',8-cyclase